jgi:hypothetical protein
VPILELQASGRLERPLRSGARSAAKALGIIISKRQIVHLLIAGQDSFLDEARDVLRAQTRRDARSRRPDR